MHNVVDPDRRCPRGSVPMYDKGSGSGYIKQGFLSEVVVRELLTALEVCTGVEQQAHVQIGPHERLMEIQIGEVIAITVFT